MTKSKNLFSKAKKIIPSGVNSPVRFFKPYPFFVKKSLGSSIWDVAAAAKSQETFWGVINFLGMPLFLLSPALFPLALMPDWLASIAAFNPVTYTVVLVREMMSGFVEGWSAILSVSVLVVFSLAMLGLASYVFTRDVNKPF